MFLGHLHRYFEIAGLVIQKTILMNQKNQSALQVFVSVNPGFDEMSQIFIIANILELLKFLAIEK